MTNDGTDRTRFFRFMEYFVELGQELHHLRIHGDDPGSIARADHLINQMNECQVQMDSIMANVQGRRLH